MEGPTAGRGTERTPVAVRLRIDGLPTDSADAIGGGPPSSGAAFPSGRPTRCSRCSSSSRATRGRPSGSSPTGESSSSSPTAAARRASGSPTGTWLRRWPIWAPSRRWRSTAAAPPPSPSTAGSQPPVRRIPPAGGERPARALLRDIRAEGAGGRADPERGRRVRAHGRHGEGRAPVGRRSPPAASERDDRLALSEHGRAGAIRPQWDGPGCARALALGGARDRVGERGRTRWRARFKVDQTMAISSSPRRGWQCSSPPAVASGSRFASPGVPNSTCSYGRPAAPSGGSSGAARRGGEAYLALARTQQEGVSSGRGPT